MNRALLILSFVFLLNPAVHLIDPLPDFIGWIMLFYALRQAKYLSVQAEYAISNINKMILLSLAGTVSMLLIPICDGTMILTLSFALGVLKLIWGIPSLKYFYSAITELSALYDGKAVYKPVIKNGDEGVKSAEGLSVKAFIANTVIWVLPEFTELTAHSSVIYSEGHRSLVSFKPIFYVAAVVLELIIMALCVWIVSVFAGNLSTDTGFFERIKAAYLEKAVKTGKTMAERLNFTFAVKAISGIFLFCVISGSLNVMPAFVYALITLFSILMLSDYGYKSKLTLIFSILSVSATLVAYILNISFASKYIFDDIRYSFEAFDLYNYHCALLILQAIVLILTEVFFTRSLIRLSHEHAMREILDISNEKYLESRKYEEKRMKSRGFISVALFAFMLIGNTVAYICAPRLNISWLPAAIVDLVWFIYNYSYYSSIREGIENKYL